MKSSDTSAAFSVSSMRAVQELKSKQFALTIFHNLSSSAVYTTTKKEDLNKKAANVNENYANKQKEDTGNLLKK